VTFAVPDAAYGAAWEVVVDTADPLLAHTRRRPPGPVIDSASWAGRCACCDGRTDAAAPFVRPGSAGSPGSLVCSTARRPDPRVSERPAVAPRTGLWVPETPHTSCDLLILVEHLAPSRSRRGTCAC
jgi:hypothetical protein